MDSAVPHSQVIPVRSQCSLIEFNATIQVPYSTVQCSASVVGRRHLSPKFLSALSFGPFPPTESGEAHSGSLRRPSNKRRSHSPDRPPLSGRASSAGPARRTRYRCHSRTRCAAAGPYLRLRIRGRILRDQRLEAAAARKKAVRAGHGSSPERQSGGQHNNTATSTMLQKVFDQYVVVRGSRCRVYVGRPFEYCMVVRSNPRSKKKECRRCPTKSREWSLLKLQLLCNSAAAPQLRGLRRSTRPQTLHCEWQ